MILRLVWRRRNEMRRARKAHGRVARWGLLAVMAVSVLTGFVWWSPDRADAQSNPPADNCEYKYHAESIRAKKDDGSGFMEEGTSDGKRIFVGGGRLPYWRCEGDVGGDNCQFVGEIDNGIADGISYCAVSNPKDGHDATVFIPCRNEVEFKFSVGGEDYRDWQGSALAKAEWKDDDNDPNHWWVEEIENESSDETFRREGRGGDGDPGMHTNYDGKGCDLGEHPPRQSCAEIRNRITEAYDTRAVAQEEEPPNIDEIAAQNRRLSLLVDTGGVVPDDCWGTYPSRHYQVSWDDNNDRISLERLTGWLAQLMFGFGKTLVQTALWLVGFAFKFDVTEYMDLISETARSIDKEIVHFGKARGGTEFNLSHIAWLALFAVAGYHVLRGRATRGGMEIVISFVLVALTVPFIMSSTGRNGDACAYEACFNVKDYATTMADLLDRSSAAMLMINARDWDINDELFHQRQSTGGGGARSDDEDSEWVETGSNVDRKHREANITNLLYSTQGRLHREFIELPYMYINFGAEVERTDQCGEVMYNILSTEHHGSGSGWEKRYLDRESARLAAESAGVDVDDLGDDELKGLDTDYCGEYSENNSEMKMDRLMVVTFMTIITTIVAAVVGLIAATLLVAKFLVAILFIMMPLAVISAILPGRGRMIAWWWLGTLVQAWLAALAMGLILALTLLLLDGIHATSDGKPLAERWAIVLLLLIVMWLLRKKLVSGSQSAARSISERLTSINSDGGPRWAGAGGGQWGVDMTGIDRAGGKVVRAGAGVAMMATRAAGQFATQAAFTAGGMAVGAAFSPYRTLRQRWQERRQYGRAYRNLANVDALKRRRDIHYGFVDPKNVRNWDGKGDVGGPWGHLVVSTTRASQHNGQWFGRGIDNSGVATGSRGSGGTSGGGQSGGGGPHGGPGNPTGGGSGGGGSRPPTRPNAGLRRNYEQATERMAGSGRALQGARSQSIGLKRALGGQQQVSDRMARDLGLTPSMVERWNNMSPTARAGTSGQQLGRDLARDGRRHVVEAERFHQRNVRKAEGAGQQLIQPRFSGSSSTQGNRSRGPINRPEPATQSPTGPAPVGPARYLQQRRSERADARHEASRSIYQSRQQAHDRVEGALDSRSRIAEADARTLGIDESARVAWNTGVDRPHTARREQSAERISQQARSSVADAAQTNRGAGDKASAARRKLDEPTRDVESVALQSKVTRAMGKTADRYDDQFAKQEARDRVDGALNRGSKIDQEDGRALGLDEGTRLAWNEDRYRYNRGEHVNTREQAAEHLRGQADRSVARAAARAEAAEAKMDNRAAAMPDGKTPDPQRPRRSDGSDNALGVSGSEMASAFPGWGPPPGSPPPTPSGGPPTPPSAGPTGGPSAPTRPSDPSGPSRPDVHAVRARGEADARSGGGSPTPPTRPDPGDPPENPTRRGRFDNDSGAIRFDGWFRRRKHKADDNALGVGGSEMASTFPGWGPPPGSPPPTPSGPPRGEGGPGPKRGPGQESGLPKRTETYRERQRDKEAMFERMTRRADQHVDPRYQRMKDIEMETELGRMAGTGPPSPRDQARANREYEAHQADLQDHSTWAVEEFDWSDKGRFNQRESQRMESERGDSHRDHAQRGNTPGWKERGQGEVNRPGPVGRRNVPEPINEPEKSSSASSEKWDHRKQPSKPPDWRDVIDDDDWGDFYGKGPKG